MKKLKKIEIAEPLHNWVVLRPVENIIFILQIRLF